MEIHVTRHFSAPAERVFDLLSDHERFMDTPGKKARVTRPGTTERNGAGAQREVRAGPLRFVEDISAFDRPRGYDYRVLTLTFGGLPIPLVHERGWLELTPDGDGTRVDWRSRFRVRVPLLGGVLERQFAAALRSAFEDLLERAATRV